MQKTTLRLFLFLLLAFSSIPTVGLASELDWDPITPGIDYLKFQLPDPNNVFVARMDRSNVTAIIESSIAQGKLAQGAETVSGMYARYDQALNYWGGSANPPTWGLRNQVVVAINGAYFGDDAIPQGGQVYSGWYSKRYDDWGGYTGFAWMVNRNAFIGGCVIHKPEKQLVTFPSTGNTQQITHVNTTRGANELVLYTPQYNTHTGTNSSGVEVLVEMSRPTMILPTPAYAYGFVRQIRDPAGDSLIPFNSIVLSASGTAAETLRNNVKIGDEIHISQEITDCPGNDTHSWTKTFAAIQGHYVFLENGQVNEYENDPNATWPDPRTAIAYNEQYIFFIVVDGRDQYHSIGMTMGQLGLFSRDMLGATWGVAEDGGGSSTMVINGQVVNNTYCNIYSCLWKYATYLPLVTRNANQSNPVHSSSIEIVRSPAGIERVVANGMLMVSVQSPEYSLTFSPGDSVATKSTTDMRLGPGTNYAVFITIPAGTQGVIVDQMNDLNGILAKSAYWWYVNIYGNLGWIPESALVTP
jgi:hypothetical protein